MRAYHRKRILVTYTTKTETDIAMGNVTFTIDGRHRATAGQLTTIREHIQAYTGARHLDDIILTNIIYL